MKFRVARHTSDLQKIEAFYTSILGLDVLGKFHDHDGYNGLFLGHKNFDWHLEFTTSSSPAKHLFDPDDLLVFYPENQQAYSEILMRIHKYKIEVVSASNPYWNKNATVIQDPDGFFISIVKPS